MYCTTAEVLGKIRDDMIDAILGSDLIEDEQERTEKITACTEEAISDACAEIDGWVSKRYKVPFLEPVPPIVSKLAKDIAVYNLASRTGIDEDDRICGSEPDAERNGRNYIRNRRSRSSRSECRSGDHECL